MTRPRLTIRGFGCAAILGGASLACGHARADRWQVTPSISLQELYTSNSQGTSSGTTDVVTQVAPGMTITEDGPYSNLTFNFSPTYNHYNFGTSPDRVDLSSSMTGKITPSENHLTIDYNGYANEFGGNANSNSQSGTVLVASTDRVLYYTATVVPHFTERFGDVATVDAYYRLKSSNTSDQGTHTPGGFSLSNDYLQNEGEVILGSGDSFGRVSAQLDFDHSISTGTGEIGGSSNDNDFLGLQYNFNYAYSLTAQIGYQRIFYGATSTTSPFVNAGMTWSVGFRIAPNQDSSLSVKYGLQEGIYVPSIVGSYSVGPRTVVSLNYTVSIQNQLESALQNLQFLTYDQFGNPIDSRTGLPFNLINSTFSSQNVLFRDKPAQLTIVHQLERSAITLTLLYEERTSVTGAPSSDEALGGTIGYARQLTPLINGDVNISYTNHTSTGLVISGGNHTQLINASASLVCPLSDTASIFFNGTVFKQISNDPALSSTTTQVIVGVRKSL
jgi:uncharacterized protein (PEP-CTERM system associated)